jgi:hypothetical protein
MASALDEQIDAEVHALQDVAQGIGHALGARHADFAFAQRTDAQIVLPLVDGLAAAQGELAKLDQHVTDIGGLDHDHVLLRRDDAIEQAGTQLAFAALDIHALKTVP